MTDSLIPENRVTIDWDSESVSPHGMVEYLQLPAAVAHVDTRLQDAFVLIRALHEKVEALQALVMDKDD